MGAIGLMYELKEVSAKRITLISKISFKLNDVIRLHTTWGFAIGWLTE